MKTILLVDGYNIIGAWPQLIKLRDQDLAAARDRLVEAMAEYSGFTGTEVVVVFDAHYVPGNEKKFKNFKVEVIFTKENESADERIEKLASLLSNVRTRVYVATSDYTEQNTIFGQGAYRKSARELLHEMNQIEMEIAKKVKKGLEDKPNSKIPLTKEMAEIFEKWRRGQK